jgi:hypothetical protein
MTRILTFTIALILMFSASLGVASKYVSTPVEPESAEAVVTNVWCYGTKLFQTTTGFRMQVSCGFESNGSSHTYDARLMVQYCGDGGWYRLASAGGTKTAAYPTLGKYVYATEHCMSLYKGCITVSQFGTVCGSGLWAWYFP